MTEHKLRCLSWFCLEEDRLPHLGLNTQEQSWVLWGGGWPPSSMYIILKIINFLQTLCKLSCSRARAIVLSKSLGLVLDIHLLFPNAIQSFFSPCFSEACSNKPETYERLSPPLLPFRSELCAHFHIPFLTLPIKALSGKFKSKQKTGIANLG